VAPSALKYRLLAAAVAAVAAAGLSLAAPGATPASAYSPVLPVCLTPSQLAAWSAGYVGREERVAVNVCQGTGTAWVNVTVGT
jgi:hypothetical protein